MSLDRERILEDALKHELRGVATPADGTCLDAEALAAWQDDGLDARTVAAMEAHVSTCARCQALVAVSLRSKSAAAASEAQEQPGAFALWKWLTPLAAATAALTLWMVVPEQQELAVAPPQSPAVKAESAAPAPAAPAAATAPARQDAAAPKEEAMRKAQALAETVAVSSASPVVTPPPPSPAASVAAAPSDAPQPAVEGLQRNRFAIAPFEIVSSDSSQRWRVTAAGVERSADLGGTWSLVRAASGETITAGVSPLPSVCWLIGNSGVVLLTADGTVFTRSVIPDAGNLRSISATDARTATVVNAAGRTFRTADGGRTWF